MSTIDAFDLIIFGDYNVLTNTPFKDNRPLHMQPGRAEYLAWVQEDRRQRVGTPLYFAVAGNKGGVAWNKHTEAEGREELRWTAEQIGSTHYEVCFGCPTCAAGFERYTTPEMLTRRKPNTVMFHELAERLGVDPKRVAIVDHYADGYKAIHEFGCLIPPGLFFKYAEQYITTATTPLSDELARFDPEMEG